VYPQQVNMRMPTALLVVAAGLAYASATALRVSVVDVQAEHRRGQDIDEDVLRSPGKTVLSIATVEHPLAWADAVWLALVQELGKESAPRSIWGMVYRWADVATDLDPQYFTVYHASAIHLSVFGKDVERSDRIAAKGWAVMPDRWPLPMIMGYNAFFVGGDAARAAELFLAASRLPGSPRYLPALAGRMRFFSGDERGAIEMLELMLEDLEGPAREDAEFRLNALRSEGRLRLFDQACEAYQAEHGRLPESGDVLVQLGLVEAVPADVMGAPVEFHAETGCVAVTENIKVRESQALKRYGAAGTSTTSTATTSGL
jgi:hypothetical protein